MDLLDSVLGVVMGGRQPRDGANAAGGGLGNSGELMGMVDHLLQKR